MRAFKFLTVILAVGVSFVVAGHSRALEQKFDNFVILVDQSGEMHKTYHGKSKNYIARHVVKRFIKNVPSEAVLQGAIYEYGIMAAANEDKILTVRSMTPFNRGKFLEEYEELKPQTGPSSLSIAVRQARRDLADVPGKTAVIIVSGGNLTDVGEPGTETKKLKKEYGDRVCVFTVLVGKGKKGGQNLEELVKKGECGFATNAGSLDKGKDMERYIRGIFFGAADDKDLDGVSNKDDKCQDTPFGASVDENGCWVVRDIRFASGKTQIDPEYYDLLDEIAAVMNANPGMKIIIEGHTDSQGDEGSNRELSERRARAVMDYLVNAEVDPERLRALGKGESEPVASNDTETGRAKNRRIEFEIIKD